MKNGMTASKLRLVLSVVIVGIIGLAAGGFWFAHKSLTAYATQISGLNADAESGDTNIRTLKSLEERLEREQDTIKNARSIVADGDTYSDQVIGDISRIARDSGVEITSFGFVSASGTSGVSTPAPAPTTPAPTGAGTETPAGTSAPSGVTKKTVSVTVKSPLRYSNLMAFIRNIESNDLKMQFASVNMTKDEGDMVATQTFSIEVYVRS